MPLIPHDRDDLLDLAADYVHGTIAPDEAARLEALLRESPAARREFVGYCMLHGQLALSTTAADPGARGVPRNHGPRMLQPLAARTAAVVAGLAAVAACVALLLQAGRDPAGPGSYDDRPLPLVTVATHGEAGRTPTPMSPSTLRPESSTAVRSASGADVEVGKAAVFGLTATDAGALYDGRVQARLTAPDANFSVTASNLRIVDKGTAFTVEHRDATHVAVTVLDGEVEVQSRVRLPVCYWPCDDAGPGAAEIRDVVGGLTARLGGGAKPVVGLVGTGAVRFDGTPAAVATIVGGTAARVGTGQLAMAEGITIEAVIVSTWSGRFGDYDEIYRKEDGPCRVLLSFQHDHSGGTHAVYHEPPVPPGPCLSFGLHLAGRGYAELDMPLDGADGRPTLAEITDGKPHHVVAAYDSFTGRKSLFIDGVMRFEHVSPVGTLVLSGGPAVAEIGNHRGREPFAGVIDEVALYDFALTPAEVAEHWRRVAGGQNYFGADPAVPEGLRWRPVTRLVEGQTMTFDRDTGLPR